MTLSKKYWVLFVGKEIKNADYLEEQTGFCNVGAGIESAEFDTKNELIQFVGENELVYNEPEPQC